MQGSVVSSPEASVPQDADVIVVGAGPAGSTTAFHLAQSGLDVLLLEKTAFPREKVCGDGLTPRAVKSLISLGVDISAESGWIRNKGLRIIGGGHTLELDWPDLADYPSFGLVRSRMDFDETLARAAQKAGARLHERAAVTGPVLDAAGRVSGVTVRHLDEDGKKGPETTYRAPLVVAADGNSSRLSLAVGLRPRDDRPMGVAVRTYYTSPRHEDDYLESWLELWDYSGDKPRLLPGYGWVFGVGRRHLERRARDPQHQQGVPERRLQGAPQGLARPHAGRVGLPRGEHDAAGARRGPADGVQPAAALPQRPAAGR